LFCRPARGLQHGIHILAPLVTSKRPWRASLVSQPMPPWLVVLVARRPGPALLPRAPPYPLSADRNAQGLQGYFASGAATAPWAAPPASPRPTIVMPRRWPSPRRAPPAPRPAGVWRGQWGRTSQARPCRRSPAFQALVCAGAALGAPSGAARCSSGAAHQARACCWRCLLQDRQRWHRGQGRASPPAFLRRGTAEQTQHTGTPCANVPAWGLRVAGNSC
jgi:hypothetical protein